MCAFITDIHMEDQAKTLFEELMRAVLNGNVGVRALACGLADVQGLALTPEQSEDEMPHDTFRGIIATIRRRHMGFADDMRIIFEPRLAMNMSQLTKLAETLKNKHESYTPNDEDGAGGAGAVDGDDDDMRYAALEKKYQEALLNEQQKSVETKTARVRARDAWDNEQRVGALYQIAEKKTTRLLSVAYNIGQAAIAARADKQRLRDELVEANNKRNLKRQRVNA